MNNFLKNLDSLLEINNISRNKLANELDIAEGTIRSWYKGTIPKLDIVIKISQYFTIPIDYLVGNDIEMFTKEEKQIIQKYRLLDDESKQAFKTLLQIRSKPDSGKLSTYKIG